MIGQLRGMRVRSGLVGIFKVTLEAQGKSMFKTLNPSKNISIQGPLSKPLGKILNIPGAYPDPKP